jgi:hypothetical protein
MVLVLIELWRKLSPGMVLVLIELLAQAVSWHGLGIN